MVLSKVLLPFMLHHALGTEDDAMNLLQASVSKADLHHDGSQTSTWQVAADLKIRPGSDNYSIVLSGLPNPDLVKNNGRDCLQLWGKRFAQNSQITECSNASMACAGNSAIEAAVYSPFVEACCPGACSKSDSMNPVKYIVENKLEEEVRCLSRYGNSIGGGGAHIWRSIPGRIGGEVSQTCDMLVLGKPGWKTYLYPNGVWPENKPNMRKMDGTWVHKVCWDKPVLRACCPKQCANAEPSWEGPNPPPAVDKSKYQDPPVWKSPEYDYFTKAKDSYSASKWWGYYQKPYEWKGDVFWYAAKELFGFNYRHPSSGQDEYQYGTLRTFTDVYDKVMRPTTLAKGTPTYQWAGAIRCEDIPKVSEIGSRELFHSVDQDYNDTQGDKTQYAEMWNMCGWVEFAIACPAMCGWTSCGAPDVGGAGNAAIACQTQKEFKSGKWVDLPREPWEGRYTEKSRIEVGPGTPTPAPGPQNTLPPTPTPGLPTPTPTPGTSDPDPGEGTGPGDQDCFDAEIGFGPDFSCANTDMYCGQDSGDGITVDMCCPEKCKKEAERKKKNEKEDTRKENIKERREKRRAKDESRRKAERERKKKNKDAEWNNKRRLKETENKNKEDERKNKRGWKEALRKKERGWKQKRWERSEKANKRERSRKEKRNKDKPGPGLEGESCFASKPNWGPQYYCAVAADSCGGDDDDTIIECCPAACPTTTTTTGPGQECFAKSESDWPGVWHCNVLPDVKNYCGCGDKYEAKVKECCPSVCAPTNTCGGFVGKKPESPKSGELKRKEQWSKTEKTRKGKWGAMREKKIKQERKNKAGHSGKREKNQKKEKSRKEARKKKKGSRKKGSRKKR